MTGDTEDNRVPAPRPITTPVRILLLVLGFACTGIGIAGLILPGLPGTPFLLLAAWLFSKSSTRFHAWLYNHPRFGKTVRDWHAHRVIPPRGKFLAVLMMAVSLAILVWVSEPGSPVPLIAGACLLLVAGWIVTRRSRAPMPNGPPPSTHSRP